MKEDYLSHFGEFEFSEDVVMRRRLADVANAHGTVFLQSRHVGPVLHTFTLSTHKVSAAKMFKTKEIRG